MKLRAILGSAGVAAALALATPALAGYQLAISPASVSGVVGAQLSFDVGLSLDAGSTLMAAQFNVNFNPAVLGFVAGGVGPLTASWLEFPFTEGSPGTITGGMTALDPGDELVGAQTGSIARLTFDLLAPGTSPLGLSDALFIDIGVEELVANAAPLGATVVVRPGQDIPEPAAPLLAALGLGLLGLTRWRPAAR